MIGLNRTLQLVTGALTDPEPTRSSYLPQAGDWQETALLLTSLLIVASTVIAYLIGLTSSDASFFGQFRPILLSSAPKLLIGAIAADQHYGEISWQQVKESLRTACCKRTSSIWLQTTISYSRRTRTSLRPTSRANSKAGSAFFSPDHRRRLKHAA